MAAKSSVQGRDLVDRMMELGLDPNQPESIREMARRHRQLRAIVARQDSNEFCRYVLRDERNGKQIVQAPMHKRWHELMNEHDRLLMWSHVEGGKTTQIAIGRTLYELGKNPNLRVAVVSNTNELARKMVRLIGQYVEKSVELHEVFPALVPTQDPSLPWKASQLTIQREVMIRDPSVQACGVHGNIIGSRVDLLILDDILDHENTHTPGPRADVLRWIKSSLFSRLTEGARVWIVGNAWHPEDAMHMLEKEPRFRGVRFPVIDNNGALTWPERWSHERIATAKQDLGALEFARQLLCQARDDASARFKKEWIDIALENGIGLAMCNDAEDYFDTQDLSDEERIERQMAAETVWRLTGRGGAIFHGVDLAVSRADSAGKTVIFSIAVDERKRRRVLAIRAGRWSGPEIMNNVKDVYEKFGGIFIIENNATQQMVIDMLRDETDIPILPFTTGRNKADPSFGVETLAAEMAGGKWEIPNRRKMPDGSIAPIDPEVDAWIAEMLFYDPKEHTGDRLMASWFAREGARQLYDLRGARKVNVRVF